MQFQCHNESKLKKDSNFEKPAYEIEYFPTSVKALCAGYFIVTVVT